MSLNAGKSKVEAENHGMTLRKLRQSSVQMSHRKALTEIGNVVQRNDARVSVSVEFMKDEKKPMNPARRSTRASVAMSSCRTLTLKPEDPVQPSRLLRNRASQIGIITGPPARPAPSDGFVKPSVPRLKRKSSAVGPPRRPRLTLKPPAVDTPPAERLAAEMKLRASLIDVKAQVTQDESQSTLMKESIAPALPSPKDAKQPSEDSKKKSALSTKDDVDYQHRRCLWMVTNYVERVYAYLQKLDRKTLFPEGILTVTEHTRTKMVDWLAGGCHMLHLLQETFQLSVSILDRVLLSMDNISEKKLLLVALTCLSLSVKYEEMIPSSIQELLSLTENAYSLQEVLEMERKVMEVLEFQVARPVPIVFLRRYNLAARCDRVQHTFGKYLIDLAQLDWELTRQGASPLAAATVFVATCIAKSEVDSSNWNSVLRHYTRLTYEDIKPLVTRMAEAAITGGGEFRAVKRRYGSESLYKVSEKLELHHSILVKLTST